MRNNGSAANISTIPNEDLAAIIRRLKNKSNCSGELPSGDNRDAVAERNAKRKAMIQSARKMLKEDNVEANTVSFLQLAMSVTRADKAEYSGDKKAAAKKVPKAVASRKTNSSHNSTKV